MAYISFQPKDNFKTKIYSGTGSSNAITGVGFRPDLNWIKARSHTYSHSLTDVIRGVTKHLASNNTNAEYTSSTEITSFDSDGFTLGTDSGVNNGSHTFVSWNWKAGGTGSANSDGSISSTVSANTTSGFSIVKFTGTGANGTVGHGLGAAVDVMIMKQYEDNSGYNWKVYERGLGANKQGALDVANAFDTNANYLNNTHPTSSVFSVGADNGSNKSGDDMIVYCFAEKKGFSKFGTYVGNGSSTLAPFIYTGFKPALVIGKNTDVGSQHWFINDNQRLGYNGSSAWLKADGTDAELTNLVNCDFLSNGFKLRNNNDIFNDNGAKFFYMAFAEEPLVASNGTPATAR